jgi:putative flippase GtrA
MIRHFLTWQFVIFILVGTVAALLHWLSRVLFSIWLSFPVAVFFAYIVGMAVAFLLNSIFVFPNSSEPRRVQAMRFVWVNLLFFPVVWCCSVLFSYALREIGVDRLEEELAHALAISIPVFATFLLYKFFAFGEEKHG